MKQLLNKDLSIFYVLLSTICLESGGQSCPGTKNGMSTSGSREDTLERITKRFSKCTKIDGNLEISYLPSVESDVSFLSTIEEVTGYVIFFDTSQTSLPLTNLRIIRGRNLYEVGNRSYSLLIIKNRSLKDLGLISLKEISQGDVMIFDVGDLCYIDTVLWSDIFSSDNSTIKYAATGQANSCNVNCHESCPEFNGKRYCWGPGEHKCQKLNKALCHEGCKERCFGKDWNQCCSDSCAGGCTGRSNKDCFGCRTFSDGDACVDFCPPPAIYDPTSFAWKPNPMFKYSYGHECVSKCPDFMYIDREACVRNCPEGKTDVEGVCKQCVGPCPKVCPGTGDTYLSNYNIESFKGCTIIQGNLYIAQTTFKKEYGFVPLTYENLSLLENVTLIEGSVRIEADSPLFRNLSFLRNVKTIVANKPLNRMFGLTIFLTSLEILGLDSLQSVMNGKLIIIMNKHLCYAEKFDWTKIRKNHQDVVVKDNKDISVCESEGKVCHQECVERSCVGPLDTQCIKCRNYKQGNRCLRSCELGWYSMPSDDGSKECFKCHKECRESCFGPGSDKCHKCMHFKDGRYCVESCPEGSQTCRGRPKPKVSGGKRPPMDDI